MRVNVVIACALLAVAAAAPEPPVAAVTSPVRLFDGRSLDGWYTWTKEHRYDDPARVFTVKDGVLRISGEEWGGIATRAAYRDYHLVVEWKWGSLTWGERKSAARDSGILVHGIGPEGAASGVWLESYEAQVIEGGVGDLILVAGEGRPAFTATARQDGEQFYWEEAGPAHRMTEGRLNWFGRDPAWKDVLGFRGRRDVEHPAGEWNRQEVIAARDTLTSMVNGVVVARATACSHQAGKIQLQSEGAEIFVRSVEMRPL
jgi:3-keto-disaccharide hydrolase